MKFSDIGLGPEVLRAVEETGYETPTPIQEKAIPYVLQGRDVLGCAQTGTGKTASFVLPMLDILATGRARARMPRALILEPTRELAFQVAENFEIYGKYQKLSMALLIGGVSFAEQAKKIDRGVDVLIATPGRLLDHVERGQLMLTGTNVLVIDEADRMLDMGFIPDIERIVKLLPPLRQTLFFSATMPKEIRRLADKFLSNPREVTVAPPASPAETVKQAMAIVPSGPGKREALRQIMRSEEAKAGIIFCNRKRDVDVVANSLKKHGFDAGALHGDMSQPARMETLEKFKAGELAFLVASDVAARGLDVSGLPYVFNFDMPTHAEDYIHRIGRTGRAGLQGTAISLATSQDTKYIAGIEKLIGGPIPRLTIGGDKEQKLDDAAPAAPKGRGRGRGKSADKPAARSGRKTETKSAETEVAEVISADPVQADAPVAEAPKTEAPKAETVAKAKPAPRRAKAAKTASAEPDAEKPARSRNSGNKQTRNKPDTTRSASGKSDRSSNNKRGQRRDRDDDKVVVGMGDHMPAFLARPVELPAKPDKSS
ncbi:MAG: DEAD/DEAH box helicase [Alphaproteobacteria bacterium]|jgi:superfamily II DNA/RNA helicase|nr:DEAD/DEAH box helicase [Alphaproteobacteria bacterium]MBT4082631.1 DEAD/DEAH box helicase [Alphaproteobacteria bacterium]MBT4545893.1 DEAD/DEAH box helicase [Alphaproteobacteria bacterium]MBT7746398.1 DEAD/DEAH box helicase [Alphaproteobacteria bacterium]